MQLEKKSKICTCLVELAVMGLCLILNVSFLHSAGILDWGYFDIPENVSGYALYLTSFIGTLVISKRVADFFNAILSKA
ncbi:hypothetical protein ABEG74_09235 [Pantoea agglomerans]|jgi:hypothetical protein|uniref:hypothetical protein n=1 Tax=Enterobacter agglomerans TaxID=549 RepID=UPI0013C9CF93|nr:hypothetical protein [Pantoea agglomerans]MBD8157377.1 hypothetical protein [Pantoea agglomerans]MBD8232194.1 hypothetical protein [Pantoea agglomerans]NEG79904.1 hypothetical protein [Pantoea agglomerans]